MTPKTLFHNEVMWKTAVPPARNHPVWESVGFSAKWTANKPCCTNREDDGFKIMFEMIPARKFALLFIGEL